MKNKKRNHTIRTFPFMEVRTKECGCMFSTFQDPTGIEAFTPAHIGKALGMLTRLVTEHVHQSKCCDYTADEIQTSIVSEYLINIESGGQNEEMDQFHMNCN